MWEGESGADAAARLLRSFDRATGTWRLPQTGDFWDAVFAAWQLGRHGEGVTIAVIDDGFDVSYPGLEHQETPWGVATNGLSTHGTAVALLILAVAPRARLILYSVASVDGWKPDLIEKALGHAKSTDASIVNLSLGLAHRAAEVYDLEGWMSTIKPWPGLRKDDIPFMIAESECQLNGWRDLVRVHPTSVGEAAIDVSKSGRTVIAATGNAEGYIFEPALLPSIYSAAFHQGRNPNIKDMFDRVNYVLPGFSQSAFRDFGVFQPRDALGSSFAAPLVTGMAALMKEPKDLSKYRDIEWLSGIGSELEAEFVEAQPKMWEVGIDRWFHVVDLVYTRAVDLLPEHSHVGDAKINCPECSFFAVGMLGNYGLWKLNCGLLDRAEELLLRALAIAPGNAHVLLMLGRLWAIRADWRTHPKERSKRVGMLNQSARFLQKGLSIQHFDRDQELLDEVRRGLRNPDAWHLPATYVGW